MSVSVNLKESVIDGKMAKENIKYAKENELELVSKLNPLITQGARKKEDEFEFNKDAGMYVCKAVHMAIRRARQGRKNVGDNQVDTYYFDTDKCKQCPFKEGCYKEGANTKTYSVSIKSMEHSEQKAFQESEYFKEKAKERYKIEAKNSELKHRHGYDVASTSVLVGKGEFSFNSEWKFAFICLSAFHNIKSLSFSVTLPEAVPFNLVIGFILYD